MDNFEDKRLKLIGEILRNKRNSSRGFVQYMRGDHEYGQGDIVHMREAHFILAVGPGKGKTMSEIAQAMLVTQGAVSQTASRLEKKGFLIRKKDPDNHRQIVAALLKKGEDFYHRHMEYDTKEFADMDKQYLSRFTDEELQLISDYEKLMAKIFAPNVK